VGKGRERNFKNLVVIKLLHCQKSAPPPRSGRRFPRNSFLLNYNLLFAWFDFRQVGQIFSTIPSNPLVMYCKFLVLSCEGKKGSGLVSSLHLEKGGGLLQARGSRKGTRWAPIPTQFSRTSSYKIKSYRVLSYSRVLSVSRIQSVR